MSKTKPKPTRAWAITYPANWVPGEAAPYLDPWSVRGSLYAAIGDFGRGYANYLDETPQHAWKRAYRKGFRAVPVELKILPR